MVLTEKQHRSLSPLKLLGLLAAVVLLSACQSSPQRAPIEAPGEQRMPAPESGGYPDHGDTPGGTYPTPTAPGMPPPPPGTTRPPEPPNVDAAVDAIEADAQRYMAQKEWKKSLEAAEQGLRIDRRNAEFYRIMGESYRQLGDTPQAERFARQAERYCRHDCGSTRQLIRSLNLR